MGGGALIIGSFSGSLLEWPTIHLGGGGGGEKDLSKGPVMWRRRGERLKMGIGINHSREEAVVLS